MRRHLPKTNSAAPVKPLADAFDIQNLPAGLADDPFPTYRALLEHAPVKRFPDGSIVISRWADLDTVYRDTKRFSSDKTVEFLPKYDRTPLYEHRTTSRVYNDPPLHTRARKIMAGAVTPCAIQAMAPGLEKLVDSLLDALAEKRDVDLISDFARRIPIEVIGNLFDIPHSERGPLRDWSLAILGALRAFPNQKSRLLAEPQLIETAIDEFLRFQSQNQLGNRMTTEPVEIGGAHVESGTRIHLCIGAANRDPRQFDNPDRLDLARRPNKHLAFAGGPHTCVGFTLARMEGRIAIGRFLERFPDYRLIGDGVRSGRVRFRGFEAPPVSVA